LKTNYLQNKTLYPPLINVPPHPNLSLIIVIPAFNEPNLQFTLNSLLQNKPGVKVEVIVCINYPENALAKIKKASDEQYSDILEWSGNICVDNFSFYPILLKNLPSKKAGVGYARKVAMDEAARRFNSTNNKKGVIINLDADCLVSENYINAISKFYKKNPNCIAANIYFEHIAEDDSTLSEGIILYELHLRYIVEALRYCNYPYAYHTVGSSFSVNTLVYQQQGGMNVRKAGEDFYFLHKIFLLGNFGEISDAIVYPSSRSSNRVPFGTGKSIADWQNQIRDLRYSYSFKIFEIVKSLFENPILFYNDNRYKNVIDESLVSFLESQNFEEALHEIKVNTSSEGAFVKRYYRYWAGFKLWRLIHYLRDNFFENELLMVSCNCLLKIKQEPQIKDTFKMLGRFKVLQKKRHHTKKYNAFSIIG